MPEGQQPVAGVRSDEPRAAGDEDLHFVASSPLGDLAVDVEGRRGRRAPGELAGPPQPQVAQPVPVRPDRLDDGPGDGRRVLRVGQDRGSARGLRHGAGVRGHDRAAAGHGLEDGQPEGLVERRVDEHVGRLVEVDGLLERDPADEDDVARRCRARPRASAARPRTSRPARRRRSPAGGPRAHARASAQARSSPSQFLYGHSEDTNSTNGFVTPYEATCARAAPASPGLNRSWSTAS